MFPWPGAATTLNEKLADAAEVQKVTGICPGVAIHIPWDKADDWQAVKDFAHVLGLCIGAVNPNLFQEDVYRFGSLCHFDRQVRQRAVAHVFECIQIAQAVGSDIISLWLADGTNYPGQDSLLHRRGRLLESLLHEWVNFVPGTKQGSISELRREHEEDTMALNEPYPDLDELFTSIGEAGLRLSSFAASEGAAGNISLFVGWSLEVRRRFPLIEEFELPQPVPVLAEKGVMVTGSGRRLRDIHADPLANLGVVVIGADGQSAHLYTSPRRLFARVTSEFNSHLAVHADQVGRTGTNFQALIHAQPPHLVYLSHIAAYRDQEVLNRRLLRWEPETIVQLPEGVGVLPFILPSSPALMEANVTHLRKHRLVLWSKHGVMARSEFSATQAADLIEYIETAARYEYMDLVNESQAEGLTQAELRAVVEAFHVPTTLV